MIRNQRNSVQSSEPLGASLRHRPLEATVAHRVLGTDSPQNAVAPANKDLELAPLAGTRESPLAGPASLPLPTLTFHHGGKSGPGRPPRPTPLGSGAPSTTARAPTVRAGQMVIAQRGPTKKSDPKPRKSPPRPKRPRVRSPPPPRPTRPTPRALPGAAPGAPPGGLVARHHAMMLATRARQDAEQVPRRTHA